jgi:excinuclease ABC subunit A
VSVELLFLPSVYTPCRTCRGKRYNEKTFEITCQHKNMAKVLHLSVESASEFFAGEAAISRALDALLQVGLGYLRLGQLATELSGGEAQRIKLATELQRAQRVEDQSNCAVRSRLSERADNGNDAVDDKLNADHEHDQPHELRR